jgi:hypothetical protein
MKVVQFFEGHNFYVGWHFKFEMEICVKLWSMPAAPVHQHQQNLHFGVQFMQSWLRETP